MIDLLTPYISFNREQWANLRNAVPLTLNESDIEKLRGINERLTLEEVEDIYLPLTRMLNLYVKARQGRTQVMQQFIGESHPSNVPYIIGIAGSVAVGKSTIARLLKTLLERWPEHPKVELVTTDGFLYPNDELNKRGLMQRKGFPESYDMRRLMAFVSDVKSCKPRVEAPVYSHLVYDVTDKVKMIDQPDVLILEGLNVLQSGMDYPEDPLRVFVSDFLDFSIYVDANQELLKTWYINRFLTFRQGAFQDPDSYFHHYTKLSDSEAIEKASSVWDEINGKNLVENILPTRERAGLILQKGKNHLVQKIKVRK